MKISQSAVDRLLKINWFLYVGKNIDIPNVALATSANEAGYYLAEPEWENVTLEAANDMSGYLATNKTAIFQEWNDVAKEAKIIFEKKIKPNILHLSNFDNTLLNQCLEWDVIHYLIEDFYRKQLKNDLFFNRLISIYELGHMPCGWVGDWPNGKLIVY